MRALVILVLAAAPASEAHAGSRPYAFTQGAEGLAANELELESWFTYENPRGMGTTDLAWDWWLGPVTGITDHLEAGLFAIFNEPAAGALSLEELRLQITYEPWERGSHAFELRVRGELGVPLQFVPDRGAYSVWLTAIVAKQVGRLDLTANAGVFVEREKEMEASGEIAAESAPYTLVGLGASYDLGVKLRAGLEAYSEVKLAEPANGYWFGPAIAYGTGRFWLAGSFLFGLTGETNTDAKQMGRVVLGITI
jgi:hypothetical protein